MIGRHGTTLKRERLVKIYNLIRDDKKKKLWIQHDFKELLISPQIKNYLETLVSLGLIVKTKQLRVYNGFVSSTTIDAWRLT